MVDQCTIRQVDRDTWMRLAPEFSDYNYRQAWDFGTACAVRVGALSEHIAIESPERKTVALADVRIRKIPMIGGGIAYINGGPLVWHNGLQEQDMFPAVVKNLVKEYVVRRKLTLRIAPPLIGDFEKNDLENVLVQMGFAQMPNKKKTILLDLSQDEGAIRKGFHQKWRNCLNKCEKNGLIVRIGKDYSMFQEFIPLFNELIAEKNFSVDLDVNFYADVQKGAASGDNFFILLAEYEGKPIAGHVASILGDTCVYLLGAANNIGREMNAAYLLQWKAIQLGKAAVCRWYDLGGIDPDENPGVYNFKKRMGGQEKTLPGPYQVNPAGIKSLLTQFGEVVYSFMKPYLKRL
ncbi:aminoacyltransferase [Candidatus Roizmanbacteria bacterium]|nr:aminoacyltransferase [Candidatus Roizmanbacteria bacterium]